MSARVTQAEMDDLERRIRRLEANAARLAAAAKGKPVMVPLERSGEPLLGWRLWTVFPWTDVRGRATVRLKSYNGHAPWTPREPVVATCNGIDGDGNEPHDAPHPGCTCGVWAFRSRELLDARLGMMRGWVDDNLGEDVPLAVGRVSLWGRVLEFRDGYRAERAYPYALTVLSEDERLARTLAGAYGGCVGAPGCCSCPSGRALANVTLGGRQDLFQRPTGVHRWARKRPRREPDRG